MTSARLRVGPPLGESGFWTPMGSMGPRKSGRVTCDGVFLQSVEGQAFARRRVTDGQGGRPATARRRMRGFSPARPTTPHPSRVPRDPRARI